MAGFVVGKLGDRDPHGGGAIDVELDEKGGPFGGDAKSGPCHLEGWFADTVECSAYVPGRD